MPLTVLRRGKPTPRLRSLSRAHSYKETRVDVCLYVYIRVRRWSRSTRHDTGPFTQVRAWKVSSVVYMQLRKEALTRKLKKSYFFKSVSRGTNERCHGVAAQSVAQKIALVGTARATP